MTIVFQQQPARFSVAAIVNGIHELVVVLIVRVPFHADRIAVMTCWERANQNASRKIR